MNRLTYAYGYKSRDAAEQSMLDDFATGDISHGDQPRVESYKTQDLKTRWRVTVNG